MKNVFNTIKGLVIVVANAAVANIHNDQLSITDIEFMDSFMRGNGMFF